MRAPRRASSPIPPLHHRAQPTSLHRGTLPLHRASRARPIACVPSTSALLERKASTPARLPFPHLTPPAELAPVERTRAHDPARLHRPTFPTLLWQPNLCGRKLEPRVGPGIDSTVGRGVLPHARPAGGLPLPGSWLTPRRWRWLLATCRCAARWLCEGVDPCGQREEGGAGAVCGDAVGRCRRGFC